MKTERYYVSENVTLIVEFRTGRLDIEVRRYYGIKICIDFWYATRDTKTKKWDLNYCLNGFCYNSAKLTERFASRADVIKHLSERSMRIYNKGFDEIPVEEIKATDTPAVNELTESETKYCVNDLSVLNGYCDTDSVKTRGNKKHYYKMNSMGQWYELNKNNFMILWTSENKFHVYLNEKCIGHGEICRSKLGFIYESDEYIGFINCDVENVTIGTIRKKVRRRMLEYYADEISESGNIPAENERQG